MEYSPWFGPLLIQGRPYPLLHDGVVMNKESPRPLLPNWLMIKGPTPTTKAYDMADDPDTDDVVSWRPDGRSFVVWNVPRFTRDLLPKYFNCYQFTTFTLHLIICGFKFRVLKRKRDQVEFAKEGFVRGKRNLLNIEPNLAKLKNKGETDQDVKEEIKEEVKEGIKVEIKQVKEVEYSPWFGPLLLEGRPYPLLHDGVVMNKGSPSPLLPNWLMIKGPTPTTKAYDMADDPATNDVVSWRPDGRSFVVWNVPRFTRDLLPKYFNCHQFNTFTLHLVICGFKFRLLKRDQVEFAKEGFVRGKRHLLNIEPNLDKLKNKGETDQDVKVKEEIKEEVKEGIKVEITQVKEVEIKEVKDLTSSSLQKFKKRRIDGLSACSGSYNF